MQQSTISGPGIPTQQEADKLFKRLIANEEQTIFSCEYDAAAFEEQVRQFDAHPSEYGAKHRANSVAHAAALRAKVEYRRGQIAQLKAIFNALPAGE